MLDNVISSTRFRVVQINKMLLHTTRCTGSNIDAMTGESWRFSRSDVMCFRLFTAQINQSSSSLSSLSHFALTTFKRCQWPTVMLQVKVYFMDARTGGLVRGLGTATVPYFSVPMIIALGFAPFICWITNEFCMRNWGLVVCRTALLRATMRSMNFEPET